jgi:polyisoprenyl-teichoic acid--peptidoglycan teichoic acid transferase
MVRDVDKLDDGTRAALARKRRVLARKRRAVYRKRRLMAVAVLASFSFSFGAYAAFFFEGGGGSEPRYSAGKAGEIRSPSVDPLASREPADAAGRSTTTSGKTSALAFETTEDPATFQGNKSAENAQDKPITEEPPKASSESLNVLVLGVDRRPEDAENSVTRSDTMMLVQLTPQTGRVKLLSVPRDLLVEVEPGVEDRINQAYAYGGIGQAKAVMENLTGIPIDRYAIIDFGSFEEVIDALGGITLEVEQPIQVGIEGHRVYIPAGRQELDGLEALAYARYRGTPCGDVARIERQQQLVAALREEALEWNTVTELPRIAKVMHENVDTNVGIVQAISLGQTLVRNGADVGIKSAQLKGKPEILPNGNAVLVPDEQANASILENFRSGGTEVGRSDRVTRAGGSSSEC